MDESTSLLPEGENAPQAWGTLENDDSSTSLQEGSQPLTRHEKAAWIVDETTRGGVIRTASDVPLSRATRSLYLFYMNASWVRRAAVIILVLLSFVEMPSWCSEYRACERQDGANMHLSGAPYLSPAATMTIDFVALFVLVAFALLDLNLPTVRAEGFRRLHSVLLALLALNFVYVLVFGGFPPVRVAPFLRACLPLFYWQALSECFMAIFAVINPFVDVVVFVALFTFLFGWIVTTFFHDVAEAEDYFGDLGIGLYSAFTSLTTADWPMQVMGVLNASRATAILLVIFIVIGVFLLLNVLLAVVYNAYTGYIEGLVLQKLRDRLMSTSIAYDVLSGPDSNGPVYLPDIKLLFQELRKNRRHAHFDEDVVEMVFTALDDNSDKRLSRDEFLDIVEVLQLKFVIEMESPSPLLVYFPDTYYKPWWQNTMKFVKSKSFLHVINAFMLFNVAVVAVETTMDLRNKDTPASVMVFSILECAFSAVYIVEMVLKILTLGFDAYWRDLGNRFDFWVTWLLLIASTYVILPFIGYDQDLFRFFIILRCLRLFELLAHFPRFRRLVHVFSVLVPASFPLFTLFALSLYVFSAAGVELFGGLIYEGNPKLNPDLYPKVDAFNAANYWALNFNDMASGWFTLFSSIVVGYLTEIAAAISSASRFGEWTIIFFISNFVVNTLIVSNCVVAFVVDLFVMEDEAEEDPGLGELQMRYGAHRVKVLKNKTTAHQVYATMFRERIDEIMKMGNDSVQA